MANRGNSAELNHAELNCAELNRAKLNRADLTMRKAGSRRVPKQSSAWELGFQKFLTLEIWQEK